MYKPKILLLVDYPNWAFDFIAKSIKKRLSDQFNFTIKYSALNETLDATEVDLVHVFCWGSEYYKQFNFKKEQIIKEVASERWNYEDLYGHLNAKEFAFKYLNDCSFVVTPALSIYEKIKGYTCEVIHLPNGVESDYFHPPRRKKTSSKLTIGWVGNPNDPNKGLFNILLPAVGGHTLLSTNGRMSRNQLSNFYKEIDVLAITSVSEGQPLPLLESMSAGCFPVVTNVGIVPEIIINGINGLVINRSVDSFKEAFEWCEKNIDLIRSIGSTNRNLAISRSWDQCICRFDEVYHYAYRNKVGLPNNKINSIFCFDSSSITYNSKRIDDYIPYSKWLQHFRQNTSEIWSRFWLGDPYVPGFRQKLESKISDLSRYFR